MKVIKNYLGGVDIKYHNPVFKEVVIEGDVSQFRTEPYVHNGKELTRKVKVGVNREKRNVTICQVAIPTGNSYITSIGVSIMNPTDKNGSLGENISEGRAIKNPVNQLTLVSARRLPTILAEEQIKWAEKYVENNLDNFVNNIRETLKA